MSGSRRKRCVLFLNHWARYLGGAEYSLLDILPQISRSAEVHLVTSESGTLLDRLEHTDIIRKVIPCVPNVMLVKRDSLPWSLMSQWHAVAAFLLFVLKVRRYVSRVRPDCIHANVPKSHMTLFLLHLLGYRGGGIVHMREIFPRKSIAYCLYGVLFPFSRTGVIAISEAVKKALPRRMRKETKVIYNGVAIGNCGNERNVPPPVKFLYLGRIVPWKGCHLLIDAFSGLIKSRVPGSATFTLTGATVYWDPAYRAALRRSIRENHLEGMVTLSEMTDDPYRVLCSHHVLCMASRCEPFGRVAVEAQGCGLPVIGFSSGGLPEIVVHGETGLLVDDGNTAALTGAMTSLVANSRRIIEMGKKGRTRAERLFNRERQVPLTVDFIIDRITEKPRYSQPTE
ncbi:MAG: glycosyltransferase family 4 protein [Chitinispirillaceae bacterium]|nr:glycosyltransferase family 4 protein [Chitinispirillaceae bacterium]